jgi:hypothetical protein
MSEIEKELKKAGKMRKEEDDFNDRQDYLAAVVRTFDVACQKDGDLFDSVSDKAADWFNDAVDARNNKDDIEDFPDLEEADDAEDEAEESEADEGAESSDADEGSELSDEEAAAEAEAESDNEEAEAKAAKKAAKPKAGKATTKPVPAKAKKKTKREPTGYENITGEKDRFGVILGTKTAKAVEMYERGASLREIKTELGGKFYNILTQLAEKGHRVEKLPGHIFKLTHKDDFQKKKGK